MSEWSELRTIIKKDISDLIDMLKENREIKKAEKEYYKQSLTVLRESIETARAAGDEEYVNDTLQKLKELELQADINLYF